MSKTPDSAERIKIYQKLDEIVTDDAPWLFLMYPIEPRVAIKKLTWVSANSFLYTIRNAALSG